MALVIIAIIAVSIVTDHSTGEEGIDMGISLRSSVFEEGGMMPDKCSWRKGNMSPDLEWANIPEGAKSLAIICDDPDAPGGTWVHWVIFNIPPGLTGLKEGIPHGKTLPDGSMQGTNDFPGTGYDGPWPPSGTHRYYFKIYAIDKVLPVKPGAKKDEIETAMNGHILGQGQLMGRYKR